MKRHQEQGDSPSKRPRFDDSNGDLGPDKRVIYMGNLPVETTIADVLDAVKCGLIEHARLLPPKHCAFITFVKADDAQTYHDKAQNGLISFSGQPSKVGWGNPAPISPAIMEAIEQGATRTLFVPKIPNGLSAEAIAIECGRFGEIQKVDIVPKKNIAFVHFCSIKSCLAAKDSLGQSGPFTGIRLNFGKDPCDNKFAPASVISSPSLPPPSAHGREPAPHYSREQSRYGASPPQQYPHEPAPRSRHYDQQYREPARPSYNGEYTPRDYDGYRREREAPPPRDPYYRRDDHYDYRDPAASRSYPPPTNGYRRDERYPERRGSHERQSSYGSHPDPYYAPQGRDYGRGPPPPSSGDGLINRTVYIGGLPEGLAVTDVLDSVRGGMLEKVKHLEKKQCLFLTFVYPDEAADFVGRYAQSPLFVKENKLRVSWGKPSPQSPAIMEGVRDGASRVVYLGNIPEDTTEQKIRETLEKFGTIERIKKIHEGSICFVDFYEMRSAQNAVTTLRSDEFWGKIRVGYGKDRCVGTSGRKTRT